MRRSAESHSCDGQTDPAARAGSGVGAAYRFRSIMSYALNDPSVIGLPGPAACASESDCPLIGAYTNWNLQWAGASGIQPLPLLPGAATIGVQSPAVSGQPKAHAFDTLQRIGPIVANYRTRPDSIFANGFQ